MQNSLIPCCRECLAPIERRDRCFWCGARYPHLSGTQIRAHNRVSVLFFTILATVMIVAAWGISLLVTSS